MSSIPDQKEAYSFEKKKKLAARISDMRDKDTLRKIRDIIFTENPDINAKKSSGGYLMYFQNYTVNTYIKIEKYLNKLDAEKLEKITRSITENSDHPMVSSEADMYGSNIDYTVSRSKLKYSNKERRLIKRTQYEKCVNEIIPNITSNGVITETNEIDTDGNDTKKSDSKSSEKNISKSIGKTSAKTLVLASGCDDNTTGKITGKTTNKSSKASKSTDKKIQTIFSKSV